MSLIRLLLARTLFHVGLPHVVEIRLIRILVVGGGGGSGNHRDGGDDDDHDRGRCCRRSTAAVVADRQKHRRPKARRSPTPERRVATPVAPADDAPCETDGPAGRSFIDNERGKCRVTNVFVGVFSRFCFFFVFFDFLNCRNNRRRPAADNSSGVIRRFPFRSRSLVSVCTFGINYHHTCWRKQTRFVILISLQFFFFFIIFPGPLFVRLLLFFPK